MKNGMLLIVAATGSLVLSGGTAFGQDKPADCTKVGGPEMIEGEVTNVDMGQNKLMLRARDGTMHEFKASPETLGDYKVGDPIKAKQRKDPRCN